MENIKTPLNYGSIAGVVAFSIFLIIYMLGYNPLGSYSWVGAWVPIVFIILGIKKHRDQNLEGFITYGQAFGMGFMITFIFASLFGLLVYIFGTVVDPGIVEMTRSESLEAMQQASDQMPQIFSEELYDKMIEQLEAITISSLSFSEFTNKLFWGIIISLLAAAFLKHSKSPFEEDSND
ncbi:MAG: DUF4199 domain-containing protein [Bacteroidetes bacterium]|nr:DUF4199 domain-containing protein [Bacteroidota bacterium]HET6244845.1 DUF4199 domain-containing protein [Bacteroidia bacterium]